MPPLALLRLPGSAGGPSGGAPPDAMAPGGRDGRAAGSHPEDRQGPDGLLVLQRGGRRLLIVTLVDLVVPNLLDFWLCLLDFLLISYRDIPCSTSWYRNFMTSDNYYIVIMYANLILCLCIT